MTIGRSLQLYGRGVEGEIHSPRDELSFPVRPLSLISTKADGTCSSRVKHPSISFGGQTGNVYTTVAFKKGSPE